MARTIWIHPLMYPRVTGLHFSYQLNGTMFIIRQFFLIVVICGRMALDGIRMPDGCYADGTWELKMHVTDLHRDVSLRVTGEIHVGGVMLKLAEKLGERCLMVSHSF